MKEEEKRNVLNFLQQEMLALREIAALTEELSEALDRKDEVAVLMCIDMRQEAMERAAEKREELLLYLEKHPEITKPLLASDSETEAFLAHRRKYIENLKKTDEQLNRRYLRENSIFSDLVKGKTPQKTETQKA